MLGHTTSLFPLKNPALISMPLAFIVGIGVSLVTRDVTSEQRFDEAERRMHLGVAPEPVPVEAAVGHPARAR